MNLLNILLVALPVIVIAGIIAYYQIKSSTRRKHTFEFRKGLSLGREDYAKAYGEAHNKLRENWNLIEIIHDLSPYKYALGPAGLPPEITFERAFEYVWQIRAALQHAIWRARTLP